MTEANLPIEKGAGVQQMFERIAPRYDLLNRSMTLGMDESWRRKAVAALAPNDAGRYLDLCAGTLDLAAHVFRAAPGSAVVGADFSPTMLEKGMASGKIPAGSKIETLEADAMDLPFEDASFDGALCGFGVRNISDLDKGLREAARVLKPGGRFVVLEFFQPESLYERFFHTTVNRGLVPVLGSVVSGDATAYRYLGKSMELFDTRKMFSSRARLLGLAMTRVHRLFPGVASLVVLEKQR